MGMYVYVYIYMHTKHVLVHESVHSAHVQCTHIMYPWIGCVKGVIKNLTYS